MLTTLEYAAVGAVLIALAAIGLARAAVHFRRTESTGDRFFSTSLTSVALVALFVSGSFYLGRAAIDAGGSLTILLAAMALAYVAIVPLTLWRLFGPRPQAAAVRLAA